MYQRKFKLVKLADSSAGSVASTLNNHTQSHPRLYAPEDFTAQKHEASANLTHL
jgi:hypothetical protein